MSTGAIVARAAGAIIVMNLLSRLLGFVRDVAVAQAYGATAAVDAYMVAYNMPFLIQAVLGGALMTAIVPVFTQYWVKEEDKPQAWRVLNIILNVTAVGLILASILGIVFSTQLVNLFAPGFTGEVVDLAAELTAIMFPAVIFMGVGMLFNGVLNAGGHFAIPATTTGFSNLVILFTVIFFSSTYGIHGLAVGTLVSMLGYLIIQVPVLKKMGWKWTPAIDISHPGVRTVGKDLLPILIGVAVNQVYLTINNFMASGLEEGSIAALNYAWKLMQVPLGIFVVAISNAIFPTLSTQAIKGQLDELVATMMKGLKLVALITLPASVGLMVLPIPIIKLLFERGAFDETATVMTAAALVAFSVGIFAQAANLVIIRAFYARHRTVLPVVLSFLSIVINIILSLIFREYLLKVSPQIAHAGLPLANSIAGTVNTVLLYYYLRKDLPVLKRYSFIGSFSKVFLASLIMGVGAWLTDQGLAIALADYTSRAFLALRVMISIGVGVGLFGILVYLFKVEEVDLIKGMILQKLGKKRGV